MFNDCLKRNYGVSRYVIFYDLDEFIILKSYKNWKDLLNLQLVNMFVYMFCLLYFYLEWLDVKLNLKLVNKIVKCYKVNFFFKQYREK